ncbi:rho GTPase-activating protein 15 isoform X5 [Eurytemora carolleeae]|uniref:rho GTPase-activating protein 15 isoform X4 n=1 Tax=Eurytemora carolleeae TaxID=1294199 RepID=UPI000C763D7B|nr:rho GTPase-activating protein 15 isoform X4 [Eurytemora carolleeae]XP_023323289.1 rho GTPase-activating protein 15 isoform X5 [Eurytemora carolleeae]|eukprot:XP_023323288.1 rho GTPase-activating protein 15-like isoform X4 [Eurytemora affinis]
MPKLSRNRSLTDKECPENKPLNMKRNQSFTNFDVTSAKSVFLDRLNIFNLFREKHTDLKNRGIIKYVVFGGRINNLNSDTVDLVPTVVTKCCSLIENYPGWIQTEFIYRLSGNIANIQSLRFTVEDDKLTALEKVKNVHDLTGLLKLFLRELETPLIPWTITQELASIETMESQDKQISKLLKKLSPGHRATFERLMRHFSLVLTNSETNHMTSDSLGVILGPCFSWPEINPREQIFINSSIQTNSAKNVIDYYFQKLK